MKHEVATLEGPLLDKAVRKALRLIRGTRRYSMLWSLGGPIIERERIEWRYLKPFGPAPVIEATCVKHVSSISYEVVQAQGPTPLVAAMRAYVVSRLGTTVELP